MGKEITGRANNKKNSDYYNQIINLGKKPQRE